MTLAALPLWGLVLLLTLLAAVIVAVGARLTAVADQLADRTGWGEATVGAVLLGGSTSLPGIVTSVSAAATGHPSLAIANALGGIAVQTFFLTVADMAYPRANLEHAAADVTNLFQASHLMAMLALPLLAVALPWAPAWLWFSPWSLVLLAAYGAGVRVAGHTHTRPMWTPRHTRETRPDQADISGPVRSVPWLGGMFAGLALAAGTTGWVLTETTLAVSQRTGLGETALGGLVTGVMTSLPELVTAVVAVRRGALVLAVGGIIGGNAFDVVFLALADMAYTGPGTLYAALTPTHQGVMVITLLMTAVLLMGLVSRQESGGRIGAEGWLMGGLYGLLVVTLAGGG